MKKKVLLNIELPKWPAMVVVGKSVTREQAAEIIVRTIRHVSCNDDEFSNLAQGLLYEVEIPIKYLDQYDGVHKAIVDKLNLKNDLYVWDYKEKKMLELRVLDLQYLYNARICSAWIGGPHGWCNWDGTIECSNYNIGKWPSVKEVFEEWKLIAKAFPFLDLTCQLFSHEAGYAEKETDGPVIEFRVKNGKVEMSLPKAKLPDPTWLTAAEFTDAEFNEIGCTLETLKEAIEIVKRNKVESHD